MTEDQIKDEVRQSTDSAVQAITNIVRDIQNRMQEHGKEIRATMEEHKQEELRSRAIYREELLTAVENKVKTVVNGKIDGIKITVDAIKKSIEEIQPLKKRFDDSNGFWNTMKRYSTGVGLFAGIMLSIGIIVAFISRFK